MRFNAFLCVFWNEVKQTCARVLVQSGPSVSFSPTFCFPAHKSGSQVGFCQAILSSLQGVWRLTSVFQNLCFLPPSPDRNPHRNLMLCRHSASYYMTVLWFIHTFSDVWVALLWRTMLSWIFSYISPGKHGHELLLVVHLRVKLLGCGVCPCSLLLGDDAKRCSKVGVTKWWLFPTICVWGCLLFCIFTPHLTNTWYLTVQFLPTG